MTKIANVQMYGGFFPTTGILVASLSVRDAAKHWEKFAR